jgi:hypothetical protein
MFREKFTLAALVLFLAFQPAAAPAITVSWDFTGGLDHNNFTYWTNSNVTLTDTGGDLRLTKPAIWYPGPGNPYVQGGMIDAKFQVAGNFDIQVDYIINATPLANGVQIQLDLLTSPYFALVRSNEGGQNYHVWKDPPPGLHGGTSTSDNQGTLRVVRSGSTATFYEKASGAQNWTQLYSDSGFGSQNIAFSLHGQDNYFVNPTAVAFDVSFDNLQVTAESLPNLVPLPSPLLLMGTGLLALWGRRRRSREK